MRTDSERKLDDMKRHYEGVIRSKDQQIESKSNVIKAFDKEKEKRMPAPIDRDRYGNQLPMRDLASIREFPGQQHRERERYIERERERPVDRERSKDTSVKRAGIYSHGNLLNG